MVLLILFGFVGYGLLALVGAGFDMAVMLAIFAWLALAVLRQRDLAAHPPTKEPQSFMDRVDDACERAVRIVK